MNAIDLILLILLAVAGGLGARAGLQKLSGGFSALPASVGLAFVLCGAAGPLFGAVTGLSPLTSRMVAFSALLIAGMFAFTQIVGKSFGMSPAVERWGGLALAGWSAFITLCIVLVFIAYYPGGRSAVTGSLVGHLLQALQIL